MDKNIYAKRAFRKGLSSNATGDGPKWSTSDFPRREGFTKGLEVLAQPRPPADAVDALVDQIFSHGAKGAQ
jgi:hypothetical protein